MQARLVCSRFAHLHTVGVEVLHVRAELGASQSTMWSPDGETIAHVIRSTTIFPTDNTLLLTSIVSGCRMIVVPPVTPLLTTTTFWTPNSQLIVSIVGARACFVDRQTCSSRLQQLAFLQTSLPQQDGLPGCVHRAMCSRAGLVAVAHLGEQQGIITICSLIGMPKSLHILRQMTTGFVHGSHVFSPSGLLLAWADCGSQWQTGAVGQFLVRARTRVQVCELATGRCATLCRKRQVTLMWTPMPMTAALLTEDHRAEVAVCLSWAPSGTALCIRGPGMPEDQNIMPVRQVCLLP